MGNYELAKKIYCNLYKYETKKGKNLILASEELMNYISILNIPLVNATSNSQSNIYDELINELNNFKINMKSSDSSTEKSELEQFYDFFIFLIIDIFDMIIRMARTNSINYINKPAPANYFSFISPDLFPLLPKEYQCYFCILNDYIFAIYHHNVDCFEEAQAKYYSRKKFFSNNKELSLKLQLHYLFFSLIFRMIITNAYGNIALYQTETVSHFTNTYLESSETLSKKLWSWDTKFLYISTGYLLSGIYQSTPNSSLFQKIYTSCNTDLRLLISEQIASQPAHTKELLELLDHLNTLHDIIPK